MQDTWRVTQKLTVTLGVRWDTWFPDFSLNAGQGGRYDVTNNIVYIPGVGGVSRSGNAETQWLNISPRIGFAYSPDQKTVVRAGFGRGYSLGTFGWTFNNLAADVYPSIVNQSIPASSPFFPIFPLTSAPPAVVFPTIPTNGRLSLADGIGVGYIPANQKLPSVDQWNLTVEREIAPGLNLSIGYLGNLGRHLNGGFGLNAAIPGPGSDANLRRPLFQKYGLSQGIFDKCDCTSSNYNALQVQANRRFTSAYSLLASFSWQKVLDFGEFGTDFNQYDARSNYGPAGFDREFVFTLAHTLELPFGPGRKFLPGAHGVVRVLVANWSFRGITSYNSGLPFTPSIANQGFLNSPDMTSPPELIGDPGSGFTQSRNLWFNPAAYSTPPLYTFGSAGRNSLRGPNYFEADWSLSKGFKFKERYGVEFRWETFNALNHTNLALPNTTIDSSAGGLITGIASPMRNMQFGVHITF